MRRLTILLAILIFPVFAMGQAKVGTSGAQFLEINPTARATAMGDVYLSVANDAEALYLNPAGISAFPARSVIFSHIRYPADIQLNFLGVTYPTSFLGGVVGFSAVSLSMDDMPVRTPAHPEGTGQTFTASDYSAALTYSRRLTDRFSVALTGKFISEYYADESAFGWAFDIGTLYLTGFKNMRIGMCISNFGPDMKFIEQTYPLPMNFKFSISSDILSSTRHKLTLGFYGSHPNDNVEKFALGGEYWFQNLAALRGSYKIQHDSEVFNLGGGVRVPIGQVNLRLDYAFSKMKNLADLHRFTISAEF